VLVLGDSAVASFEVPPEAAFPRVAEQRLRERGRAVEFVNAGVRGWGTDQALLFLQEEGMRYAPDLVLYKWSGNDPSDNATVHRPFRRYGKPWFDLDAGGSLALRGAPVPSYPYTANLRVGEDGAVVEQPVGLRSQASLWLRDVLICRSAFATALTRAALAFPALASSLSRAGAYRDEGDLAAEPEPEARLFRLTTELVREMRRSSEAAGARFAMLADAGRYGRAVREAAGLAPNDVHERFRASVPGDDAILVPYDPHWNELGHRLYGEALAAWLLESGLLDGAGAAAARVP
jgi:hypothetical protein